MEKYVQKQEDAADRENTGQTVQDVDETKIEEAVIKVRTWQETAAAAEVATVVGANEISFDNFFATS